MTNPSESDISSSLQTPDTQPTGWLKVGIIAAVSALAAGLAAAWWYRKTLKTLRQTDETTQNPHFGIPTDEPSNEVVS